MGQVFRSAVTGGYVSEAFALANPDTTVAEEVADPVVVTEDSTPAEVLSAIAALAEQTAHFEQAAIDSTTALQDACEVAVRLGIPASEVRQQSDNRWTPVE